MALVLGSGLDQLVDKVTGAVSIPFAEVPGFPSAGVEGHEGRFVRGALEGMDVVVQAGRYHAYEGWAPEVVTAPIRVLASLGVHTVIMTGAVGGIRADLEPGDLVLLEDQMNLTFRSPIAGPERGGKERLPGMNAPFDGALAEVARVVAAELGMPLARGTYAGVLGPSYETAAEVRMMSRFGADVVGMSTVPEVLEARALGLRCVGLSLVTNRATRPAAKLLSHDDVLAVGRQGAGEMTRLVAGLLRVVGERQSTGTK